MHVCVNQDSKPTDLVSSMWLELKQLRQEEQLTGCFEEDLFVRMLVEITQLVIHCVNARLS